MTVLITHRCAALLLALFFPAPASAIVGAAEDAAAYADRVVMVLTRGPEGSAFCTGLVLDPRHVLTAAHCLRPPKDTLVLFRDPGDVPAIMLVRRTAPHPDYRRDAIRQRTLSIDVGLLETAAPLPARFRGAPLTTGAGAEIGETLFVTGFGVTREGAPKSGGRLEGAAVVGRAAGNGRLLGRFGGAGVFRRWGNSGRRRGLDRGSRRSPVRNAHPGRPPGAAAELDRGDCWRMGDKLAKSRMWQFRNAASETSNLSDLMACPTPRRLYCVTRVSYPKPTNAFEAVSRRWVGRFSRKRLENDLLFDAAAGGEAYGAHYEFVQVHSPCRQRAGRLRGGRLRGGPPDQKGRSGGG